ncbi:MAG: helix-turn-helix domain-containing protein [Rhizobiaceae bacterium]
MICVKLREAIESHRRKTGVRLTYDSLSKQTGVSVNTLQSLATRPTYNTRLSTIEKLCRALSCTPGDLLELVHDREEPPHENQ